MGDDVGRGESSWWLDEVAHAGPEHLDAGHVAGYDEKAPTDWHEDVESMLELGVGATSTVVDLGAGTGTFARAIAPYVGRVVAVDVSEPMVAAMRARGVEAVCAGLLSYEHEGDPPDAVFTRNARSTTYRTSGRRSRSSASLACFERKAYYACGTSSTRSSPRRPTRR